MPEFVKKNTNFPIILEIVKEYFTEKFSSKNNNNFSNVSRLYVTNSGIKSTHW